jgi:exopolysaccharide biosynthesis WecB/TagA/CpsF family protein
MRIQENRPLFGIPRGVARQEKAAQRVCETAIGDHYPAVDVDLANAYTATLSDRDPSYEEIVSTGSANFPDCEAIEWFGGTDGTLELQGLELERLQPGALIAELKTPLSRTLTVEEGGRKDVRIGRSGARVAWVGLGTLKQDSRAPRLTFPRHSVAIAIGVAYDSVNSVKRTALTWTRIAVFEWGFRLSTGPRRLERRHLTKDLIFLGALGRNWRAQ